MVKIIANVDGMMCGMCEAHINDAIRKHFDVKSAKASRSKKQCVIVSEAPLEPDRIASVIADTGYTLTGITSEPYEKKGLFARR